MDPCAFNAMRNNTKSLYIPCACALCMTSTLRRTSPRRHSSPPGLHRGDCPAGAQKAWLCALRPTRRKTI